MFGKLRVAAVSTACSAGTTRGVRLQWDLVGFKDRLGQRPLNSKHRSSLSAHITDVQGVQTLDQPCRSCIQASS